jgi:hypothetical protein
MATSGNILKKKMLAALVKSLGVVSQACKTAKIDRVTHYKWLKKDPAYAQQVKDIEDVAIDFAETNLHKKIKAGDTTATIFYLKTKGKGRGYIERQELTGADGANLLTSPPTTVIIERVTAKKD